MAELVTNPKFLYFYKRKTLTEKIACVCPPQTICANRCHTYIERYSVEKNDLIFSENSTLKMTPKG